MRIYLTALLVMLATTVGFVYARQATAVTVSLTADQVAAIQADLAAAIQVAVPSRRGGPRPGPRGRGAAAPVPATAPAVPLGPTDVPSYVQALVNAALDPAVTRMKQQGAVSTQSRLKALPPDKCAALAAAAGFAVCP